MSGLTSVARHFLLACAVRLKWLSACASIAFLALYPTTPTVADANCSDGAQCMSSSDR
jgi:hypothetical protein